MVLSHPIVELIVDIEKKLVPQPGIVAYACKPSIQEAEAGGWLA